MISDKNIFLLFSILYFNNLKRKGQILRFVPVFGLVSIYNFSHLTLILKKFPYPDLTITYPYPPPPITNNIQYIGLC